MNKQLIYALELALNEIKKHNRSMHYLTQRTEISKIERVLREARELANSNESKLLFDAEQALKQMDCDVVFGKNFR